MASVLKASCGFSARAPKHSNETQVSALQLSATIFFVLFCFQSLCVLNGKERIYTIELCGI